MFEKFVTDCEVFRKVKDLPWVSIDFDVERNSIEQWHKEVENNLVGLLPALANSLKSGKVNRRIISARLTFWGHRRATRHASTTSRIGFGNYFRRYFSHRLTPMMLREKD